MASAQGPALILIDVSVSLDELAVGGGFHRRGQAIRQRGLDRHASSSRAARSIESAASPKVRVKLICRARRRRYAALRGAPTWVW